MSFTVSLITLITDIPTGSSMIAVEVFITHILKTALATIKEATIPREFRPLNLRIFKATLL